MLIVMHPNTIEMMILGVQEDGNIILHASLTSEPARLASASMESTGRGMLISPCVEQGKPLGRIPQKLLVKILLAWVR